MVEKIKIRIVQPKKSEDYILKKGFEDKLETKEFFTVTPRAIRKIHFVKRSNELNGLTGEWLKSALAWSEGVLIVQETAHITTLIDRGHLQTYYYHDNGHNNLKDYLDKPIEVQVGTIFYRGNHTYVILTHRPSLTEIYNKLIEEDKPFKAKIVKFTEFGAFLNYNDLRMRLKNIDFTTSPTITVKDVYNIGDEIEVKPLAHNDETVDLMVQATHKFDYDSDLETKLWKSFEPNHIYLGQVKVWSPTKCYVRIAPGIDVQVSYPAFEVETGTIVRVKIFFRDDIKHFMMGVITETVPNASRQNLEFVYPENNKEKEKQMSELQDILQHNTEDMNAVELTDKYREFKEKTLEKVGNNTNG